MGACQGGQCGWSLVSKRKSSEEVREVLMENWGTEVSNRVVHIGNDFSLKQDGKPLEGF